MTAASGFIRGGIKNYSRPLFRRVCFTVAFRANGGVDRHLCAANITSDHANHDRLLFLCAYANCRLRGFVPYRRKNVGRVGLLGGKALNWFCFIRGHMEFLMWGHIGPIGSTLYKGVFGALHNKKRFI